jgi:hypothetical protein
MSAACFRLCDSRRYLCLSAGVCQFRQPIVKNILSRGVDVVTDFVTLEL